MRIPTGRLHPAAAFAAAVAVALVPALAGCAAPPRAQAAPPDAERLPAPVAAAPASSSRTFAMAFPTGNAATSAVLLEKTLPALAVLGQPFTYEIRVENLTETTLENVVVTEQLAPNFEVASHAPQPSAAGGVASYAFPSLPPRGWETIRITGAPSAKDALACCTSVTYEQRLCTRTIVVQPALRVVTAAPAEVLLGEEFALELTVANPGDGDTSEVTVVATLPQGLVPKTGDNPVALEVGVLKPGESRKLTVLVTASRAGVFANAAKATAAHHLAADSNTVSTVVRDPTVPPNTN